MDIQTRRESSFEFEVVTIDETGALVLQLPGHAFQYVEDLGNGVVLEMVAVPGGTYLMGSPPGQGYADEHPQRAVTVRPFHMGKYPVTQSQWEAVMGAMPPCRGRGALRPVENVSWHDAREFCRRLSALAGRTYELPSEAQWEYACRAGTTTPFCYGPTITTGLANYCGEQPPYLAEPPGIYRHGTTEAGAFPPNAFGLYDMHGNVWEWCADAWHDDYGGAPAAPADDGPWEDGGEVHYRVARRRLLARRPGSLPVHCAPAAARRRRRRSIRLPGDEPGLAGRGPP